MIHYNMIYDILCTVLYCTVLYCTVLYCATLQCTIILAQHTRAMTLTGRGFPGKVESTNLIDRENLSREIERTCLKPFRRQTPEPWDGKTTSNAKQTNTPLLPCHPDRLAIKSTKNTICLRAPRGC